MSGTAFGTIVLHITPESADGGPLGLVRTGDRIRLDVPKRSLELLVGDAELARRRAAYNGPPPHEGSDRGYSWLFQSHVTQADEGCDFDFCKPGYQ
jgi:dihydroxy-acid dehydratase